MAADHPLPIAGIGLELEAAVPVASFLDTRVRLDLKHCLDLVEQAIVLLDGLYVHLPQKRALYAVDPVARLLRLRQRLQSGGTGDAAVDDLWFHQEMVDTFTTIRDLHTMYILPEPFDRAVAFIPLRIEACYARGERHEDARRYIVTMVGRDHPGMQPNADLTCGVEVTHWNDLPIADAVERVGAQNSGSNPDARIARGVARLTTRPLARALPPNEEWVTLRYIAADGSVQSQRAQWRVATFDAAAAMPSDVDLGRALAEGLDHETHLISSWNKLLSSRVNRGARRAVPPAMEARVKRGRMIAAGPALQGSVQARRLDIGGVEYGYIRIFDFKLPDAGSLDAFVALLEQMPETGLILDIRDNPGGCLQRAEQLLQTLTPVRIEPETTQIINTPTSRAVCSMLARFRSWAASIEQAEAHSVGFSTGLPLSDPIDCNRVGQRYYGPVVLITNALCYSSADIFAAGFQDHGIGDILGVDSTTGAGGAEVVNHSFLCDRSRAAAEQPGPAGPEKAQALPGWPLSKLERGDIRLAIRRTLRVRDRAGNVLEDLGVVSTIVHPVTEDDLLHGNVDLLRRAAEHLAGRPSYVLREDLETLQRLPDRLRMQVRTRGLDRLEIALDGGFASSCGRSRRRLHDRRGVAAARHDRDASEPAWPERRQAGGCPPDPAAAGWARHVNPGRARP